MFVAGFVAELAAGGGDVAASAGADVDVEVFGLEILLESANVFVAGAVKGHAFDFVVADEVDVGADGAGDVGEFFGVLGLVVDAAEEGVFERDFAAGFVEPLLARGEEIGDGGVLGPGDELAADGVVGGVEAEGEGDGKIELFSEFFDGFGEAHGGDGDFAGANSVTPQGTDSADGGDDVGEVAEWFAHAHEDDVGDAGEVAVVARAAACLLLLHGFAEHPDLLDDFASGEIFVKAPDARGTELAADGTADLAADASGAAIFGGDHDAFGLAGLVELRIAEDGEGSW